MDPQQGENPLRRALVMNEELPGIAGQRGCGERIESRGDGRAKPGLIERAEASVRGC